MVVLFGLFFDFDDFADSYAGFVAVCELAGCGVDQGVYANLDRAVDLLAYLAFPIASAALGDAAAGAGAEALAVGDEGATGA